MTTQTLHSTVSGREEAPALLLLNSLGATQGMWDQQLPLLEQYYRVIRCDARGHGQSPTPASPFSFDDFVADAIGVLDQHSVETAAVMGLSLGGMTALGLGLTAPERVNRVICCAARADAPLAFVQNWRNRLAILESGGIEDVWESTVGFWFGDETRRSHPEREVTLRNSFLKTTEEGYRGCANALIDLDYLRHLGGMTVPTLFLAGANDTVAPPDTMRVMANACPGSAFSVVPEAKHIMNLDRPNNFVVALLGFLGLDPN